MKLADVHPTIQEGLAVHEALRRCGIAAADIYMLANSQRVAVRRAGALILVAQLIGWPEPWGPFRFEQEWREAIRLWNGGAPEEDRVKLWESSRVLNDSFAFVANLMNLGLLSKAPASLAS